MKHNLFMFSHSAENTHFKTCLILSYSLNLKPKNDLIRSLIKYFTNKNANIIARGYGKVQTYLEGIKPRDVSRREVSKTTLRLQPAARGSETPTIG